VSACCVDWDRKLVIGNVLQTPLREIWHGEKLAHLQREHLAGRRDTFPSCASCTNLFQQKDNLDHMTTQQAVNA